MARLLNRAIILGFALVFLSFEKLAIAAPGQSFEEAKKHWAYQPITSPALPKVRDKRRVQSPIDAFLLSKLEPKGLTFAPPTDKRALLRRAYYDVIGLPPTFEEIEGFEKDHSRKAFEKVVDRLLASPRYGERWGRHWLDVARYADTKDLVLVYGKDALRPYAYTYRDYVIRAFNEDLPFDQFIKDQLAADLEQPKVPTWRLGAMGFLTLGRMFDNNPHDQIDDQIDTTTRGFLGLTVACARCHDHKYDAIRQADYYGLYGVFRSSERPLDLPLLEDPAQKPGGVEFERQLAKARQELDQHVDAEFAKLTENFRQRIGDYLVRAVTTKPDLWETTQFGLSLVPEDFRPTLMLRTRRLIEMRASSQDHVFGPWAELMSLPDEDFVSGAAAKTKEWQESGRATANSNSWNPLVVAALAKGPLTNKSTVARCYGDLLHEIYEESKKPVAGNPSGLKAEERELLQLVTSSESPIWFPRRDTPEHMSRAEKDRYGALESNLDKAAANATNPPPARAMVLADLPEPYQPHIFKRGNPSRLGEAVPRAFPAVLTRGEVHPFEHGSGRLELAEAIASASNPLTARIFVNRVWMEHFGEPLVSSTTDFGTRSEPPLHGELLDWLAADFIRSGWSVKHLHRVILLSSAYQQSSLSNDRESAVTRKPRRGRGIEMQRAAVAADPENKLLSHFPRRRLDFEAMRDSLLFVSGKLDLTIGGPSVDIAADPLNKRRTVYGLVDRQNLPGVFRAFDFPVPDQCSERRPRTAVPQQTLFGMNSPFVMEQARALAASLELRVNPKGSNNQAERGRPSRSHVETAERSEKFKTSRRRVDAAAGTAALRSGFAAELLFRRVLGRHVSKQEIASCARFLQEASTDKLPDKGLTPLEQLAQVLLISNEALFPD